MPFPIHPPQAAGMRICKYKTHHLSFAMPFWALSLSLPTSTASLPWPLRLRSPGPTTSPTSPLPSFLFCSNTPAPSYLSLWQRECVRDWLTVLLRVLSLTPTSQKGLSRQSLWVHGCFPLQHLSLSENIFFSCLFVVCSYHRALSFKCLVRPCAPNTYRGDWRLSPSSSWLE